MEEYVKKTPREHILQRAQMYIGAVNEITSEEYVLDDNKLTKKEISYIPGLVKIINEIIDNSVDIAIKTDFKLCNKISVSITDEYVEITDNGPGIKVQKNPDGEWFPFVCWGYAMSGSNFSDDENRKHIGMNGVGSYCTNVWSTKFIGTSDDGDLKYTVEFSDNANSFVEKLDKSIGNGVSVKFYPDLKRFGIGKITDIYKNIIKLRLINLNMSFEKLHFFFNGEQIKVNTLSEYMKMFSETFEIYNSKDGNYCFGVIPSDDFEHYSFVNGLFQRDGGTHIDTISRFITSKLRDKLSKKYKKITTSDIKNKIFIISFLKNFTNAKFNSQTKEKLTNPNSDMGKYWSLSDWEGFEKILIKNEAIINPIIDLFKAKEDYAKKQEMKRLNKVKKIKCDKYIAASKNKKYLMIVEGESALGSLMSSFGIENCGYYMLKGKPLNAWVCSQQKFIANDELSSLYKIIRNENYKKIVYATDEDLDGQHIRALLSGFCHAYLKEYEDRIGILSTPIIAVFKGDKIQRWVYNLNEELKLGKNESSFYFKGLGSWQKDDLTKVIEIDGVDKMIEPLDFTESDESLNEWLGGDSTPRKEYILANNFSIADI